jgi:diguanylate cyclase (GGDEF)-like protein
MIRRQNLKNLLIGLAVAAIYVLTAKFSLRLASVHPSVTPVWPPTGIALATLLLLGTRFWPAILLGSFIVNITTAGSPLTSAVIAFGNTIEAFLGCYLINKFANGLRAFEKTLDIFRFALYGAICNTAIAATVGVTSLTLAGFASWETYSVMWRTWWLGDAAGALIFTPFLVLWATNPRPRWKYRQLVEAAALLASMLAASSIVFGFAFHTSLRGDPLTFLCTPFLVWAAFRFGQREASAAICILSAVAVVGTLRGYGPFVTESPNHSLLLMQSFLAVMALFTLVFGAEVSERRRQEEHAHLLAVSDPLTGLANYRLLVERLDAEIKRYGRTGRSFSLLMLDLDGLKKINDLYGHLVGSSSLCRVADVLRVHCRETDTAARFGGDEFALIMPETSFEAACQVAQRISLRLGELDGEPRLSVSIGVAECPHDGATIEHLLSAADHLLYAEKRRLAACAGR